jgi:hypothetical protein
VLELCKPILVTIDLLLDKDSPARQTIHDEIALRGLDCTVAYGNKTENWKEAKKLLEAYLKIAESPGVRRRLEENINTLQGNLESGNQWCGEGYYDLPEPILETLERARQLSNNQEYDQAINLLEGLLTQTSPALTEQQKNLVRKPLSTCLNMRANVRFTAAMQELDRPRRVIERIQANIKRSSTNLFMTLLAVSSGNEQQMAMSGNLVCMACLRPVRAWYTFTYNDTKLLICESCNQDNNRELDARKNEFKKALLKINDDLLRAIELDPTSPNPKNNLQELRKIASQLSIVLPGKPSAPARESKPAPTPKPTPKPAAKPAPASKAKPVPLVQPSDQTSFWRTVLILVGITLGMSILLKPLWFSAQSGWLMAFLQGFYFALPALLAFVLTKRPGAAALMNAIVYLNLISFSSLGILNIEYILLSAALYYICFRVIANRRIAFMNLLVTSLLAMGLEVGLSVIFWHWQPNATGLIGNAIGSVVAVIATLLLGKMFKKL